jgi:hypothetical protein
MNDKSWLLKPSAIKAAKACLQLVQTELDIRLPLSHPDFLEMLNDYAELTESEELRSAVDQLNAMAGQGQSALALKKTGTNNDTVVQHPRSTVKRVVQNTKPTDTIDRAELVVYNGKKYPRWSDDKEFNGLYRGQPRYQ